MRWSVSQLEPVDSRALGVYNVLVGEARTGGEGGGGRHRVCLHTWLLFRSIL